MITTSLRMCLTDLVQPENPSFPVYDRAVEIHVQQDQVNIFGRCQRIFSGFFRHHRFYFQFSAAAAMAGQDIRIIVLYGDQYGCVFSNIILQVISNCPVFAFSGLCESYLLCCNYTIIKRGGN